MGATRSDLRTDYYGTRNNNGECASKIMQTRRRIMVG
jgi:hypothetical protein